MFKWHTRCRACGNSTLVPVVDMGVQALANSFRRRDEYQEGCAPLQVMFCEGCSLAQLSVVVNPQVLYHPAYSYAQSGSDTMKSHFTDLGKAILIERARGPVLEIGSNNGLFLTHLRNSGFDKVLGVDPSASGVEPYLQTPFGNPWQAELLTEEHGKFGLVIARHCLAHIDDWRGFMRSVEIVSENEALIVLEVHYAGSLLNRTEYDNLYHEHLSYISEKSIRTLLKGTQFSISRVLLCPIHGGSIVFMLRRGHSEEPTVDEGITLASYKEFSAKASESQNNLRDLIDRLKASGKSLCGFGAPAKATVIANTIGLTDTHLDFVTDNTPSKIGRVIPGTNIPIVAQDELLKRQPDYAILFAWNFELEILRTQSEYRNRGGKFILPHDQRVV